MRLTTLGAVIEYAAAMGYRGVMFSDNEYHIRNWIYYSKIMRRNWNGQGVVGGLNLDWLSYTLFINLDSERKRYLPLHVRVVA